MITKTLLLLTLSVLVVTIICANIANTNIIEIIGMPGVYYEDGEISVWARGIRNFLVSIAFLGLISIVGVWYPARKASDTQPAEALHEE